MDRLLERHFARTLDAIRQQRAETFLGDRRLALAAILLFDQMPRNIHRGRARAFGADPLARALAHGVIARGWVGSAPLEEAQFMLMPLMHSEAIADQRRSLELFARFAHDNLSFARAHYRIVARFPHRNQGLGRRSSPAERVAVAAGNAW